MRKITILIILTFALLGCKNTGLDYKTEINKIMTLDIEHSLISKGNNFPDFNPYSDSLDYYLFLIHNKIPLNQIKEHTFFSQQKIDSINSLLIDKNWLKTKDDVPIPTIFIANKENGEYLYDKAKPITELIVKSIENYLPTVINTFKTLNLSDNRQFEDWSFLILSNVLLDSWQIDNVEADFLNAPIRPNRNKKNYYYSIMELTGENEAFGIYGNQYEEIENKVVCIYGNNRNILVQNYKKNFINKEDYKRLTTLADAFKPRLINLLKDNSNYIEKIYKESVYYDKISFEEFFIWWYHFIYTDVTNELSKRGLLSIPKDGNFYYEIEN